MEQRPQPFFIVGAQRSGTTMLRLMLNSHPHLAVPFESPFLTDFYGRLDEYGDLSIAENRARLLDDIAANPWVERGELIRDRDAVLARPITTYAELIDAIYAEYARRRDKRRWGDKTPTATSEIDLLRDIFPRGKIIHLVRDGRDVALSLRRVSWGSSHILRVARDWRWRTTLAHKMGKLCGDDFMEIRYEDLVRNPARILQQVCGFLDEPYDPVMLDYHLDARAEIPASSLQWHKSSIRKPDPTKAYEWKRAMSVADRSIFEEIAGDALEMFGYDLEHHPPTLLSKLRKAYYQLIRRW